MSLDGTRILRANLLPLCLSAVKQNCRLEKLGATKLNMSRSAFAMFPQHFGVSQIIFNYLSDFLFIRIGKFVLNACRRNIA